ncbi:MAG: AAA family ATPase, partial [Actinobacteria bacterium]|nr:AAA family ATPase [Actinomycetota bacterium]
MTIDMEFDDTPSREAAAERLHASVFLEAGAGTGKSTTLVSRIVNTITSDLDVDILQIAAITFTERAGAELRHRLRERLTQDLAKDPESEQLASALRSLDSATVGTIHSFAQRILRTHALSARLPLGFTVATGAEQLLDKRQRARAVIEHWVDTLPPGIIDTLASYGHSPVDLVPLIEALDEASLRLAPSAFEPGRLINTPRLCEQVADSFSALLGDAQRACSNSDDMLLNVMRASIPPLITLLRACDDDALIDEWRSIHDHHAVFTLGRGGAPTAWSGGTPAEWKARVKSLEPVLMSCLMAPLENAIRQALAVGWQVFAAARDYRASEGVIDFDGLLSRARDLLAGDREVRAQVHDEYRVLLVDEFQDTDPVQWELIRLITSDPDDSTKRPLPGRLIVVGDPKQAIYGFRGADIDTYRAALRLFSDATDPLGEVHPLVTNFRSVAPLLDWVNATFSRGMAGAPNQVAYAPLAIRHDPEHDAPGPAIVVLRDPEPVPDPTNPDKTLSISSMTLEPRLAAQEIARAIDSAWQVTDRDSTGGRAYVRQARFSDVAILYPARTGVDNLLEALDEAGVPYRSGDASLVFRRPCVAGLLAAVAVIDDPSRELDLWL